MPGGVRKVTAMRLAQTIQRLRFTHKQSRKHDGQSHIQSSICLPPRINTRRNVIEQLHTNGSLPETAGVLRAVTGGARALILHIGGGDPPKTYYYVNYIFILLGADFKGGSSVL